MTDKATASPLRMDAFDKTRGLARYMDDLRFPNMLHIQAAYLDCPHARVIAVHTGTAAEAPGVAGVFTAKDVPGINAKDRDKPVLAGDTVRYSGDAVAIVAADTLAKARAASKLIAVEYEALPFALTAREALKADAVLIHPAGNEAMRHEVRKGDVDAGMGMADIVIEREYSVSRAAHAAIEPDGAVAVPENGGLTLHCPGKAPFNVKRAVAASCGLPESRVRVIQPVTGGAFGGKDADMAIIAARAGIAALRTNRPCKCVWTREEAMREGTKRHPFTMRFTAGVKNDGTLVALKVDAVADVGAYVTKSRATVWRSAIEAAGPYRTPNVSVCVRGIFTNNQPSDAVRGLGSPQVDFAMESLMDEIAHTLHIDPYALRYQNALRDGETTATGQTLPAVNMIPCLQRLAAAFPLHVGAGQGEADTCQDRDGEATAPGRYRYGRGIAGIYRGEARGSASGESDEATVRIHLEKDGGLRVLAGIAEMGQGGGNVVLQVIGRALGVPLACLRLCPVDTDYVPDCGPTTGSRGTITSGNAAWMAAQDLRRQVCETMAMVWGVPTEAVSLDNGRVRGGGNDVSLAEAAPVCLKKRLNIIGSGNYAMPRTWWDTARHCGANYAEYNYSACGVEVCVDTCTGRIRVTKVVSVHDVGTPLNPAEVEAQVCGAVSMSLGLALTEDMQDAGGVHASLNFDKYLLHTCLDMPKIQVITLDTPAPGNPLGVKGVGEPAVAVLAPAVANAVYDALGKRFYDLPMTLEPVMDCLTKGEEEDADAGVLAAGHIG